MFGNFFNNFGNFLHPTATQQGQQAPPQHGNAKAPPASHKALSTLPMVKVTADDILEVTNKECLICLEEQKLGAWACKLPCGHLFHRECVVGWLEKHCTCPVCRFELETDDKSYETERKMRMKKRKLRLRRDEIQKKTLSQLRELARSLNVNISDCLDKHDVIERLTQSGHIEVTEGLPPMEMYESEFNAKSVRELKYLLLSFGLPDADAIEKSELRAKLINSGRIVFKPELKPPGQSESEKSSPTAMNLEEGTSDKVGDTEGASSSRDRADDSNSPRNDLNNASSSSKYLTLLSDLRACSLAEIRELCARYRVSTAGCLDKQELVDRLAASPHVRILSEHEQLAARADHLSGSSDTGSRDPADPDRQGDCDWDQLPSSASQRVDDADGAYDTLPSAGPSTHGGQGGQGDAYDTLPSPGPSYSGRSSNSRRDGAYASMGTGQGSSHLETDSGGQRADPRDGRMALSHALLSDMSVREVKSVMQAMGVDGAGCLEKGDMIQRLRASPKVRWVAD